MRYKGFLIVLFLLFALSLIAQQQNRHIVLKGETPESIAHKYNITVEDLREANPDIDMYFYSGLKLNIPPKKLIESNEEKPAVIVEDLRSNIPTEQAIENKHEIISSSPLPGERIEIKKTDEKIYLVEKDSNVVTNEMDSTYLKDKRIELLNFLIEEYIATFISGENIIPHQKRLIQQFMKCDVYQQKSVLSSIFDNINAVRISDGNVITKELTRKMALIDLYTLLADEDDSHLCDVFFDKGEICGLCTGDTIMLRECITDLKLSNQRGTEKVEDFIRTLQEYLFQIRNYLPVSQRIDGIWISDIYTQAGFSGLPSYILIIQNGKAKLDMIGYGYAETLVRNSPSNTPKEQSVIAQRFVDIDNSLASLTWSNEKLKVPNQMIATELANAGGDIAYNLTKRGTSELFGNSFMGEIGSNFVSNMGSSIISGVISDVFTPSKIINILELDLQYKNENELNAHAAIQAINIRGQENPKINKEEQEIHFTKYDPASGVFFDIPYEQKIYVPGEGFLDEIPKRLQEIGKSYIKYYDLRVPTHVSQETMFSNYQSIPSDYSYANPFNIFQNKKLQYYIERKIIDQGGNHTESKAYLGAKFQEKADKKGYKGCYVYQVSHSSPAYLFDIREGDFLLSIDGFDIDSPQQAEAFIESLRPFEWVTIQLKRGRKTITVKVELSKN